MITIDCIMATKIDLPGTDNSVDLSDPSGSVMTLLTTILGFGFVAMTASLGVKLWNKVAENTPDQLQTVDLI